MYNNYGVWGNKILCIKEFRVYSLCLVKKDLTTTLCVKMSRYYNWYFNNTPELQKTIKEFYMGGISKEQITKK